MGWWQLYDSAMKITKLSKTERDDLINTLLKPNTVSEYGFIRIIDVVAEHLTKEEAVAMFDVVIKHYKEKKYYEDNFISFLYKVQDHVLDIKTVVTSKNSSSFEKALLALKNISPDDELKGLRALAQNKYCPGAIYKAKYTPTEAVIKLLPPVTRLKALETLTNNKHLGYNIFANFKNPEEFRVLMFSSVLRHRERAEVVWNKYKEIVFLGEDAVVKIQGTCENCGDFSCDLKSTRVRTKVGLNNTRLWGSFLRFNQCVLCGRNLPQGLQIKTNEV